METALVRKDGRHVELWIAGESILSDGRVSAVHCTVKDITQRKRMEQQLQAGNARRRAGQSRRRNRQQSQEIISWPCSATNCAIPLNPVLATASMLRDDPHFDADTREQLEIICRNAELEARLIDDLLDVTRIERGKIDLDRRPVELCTIIRRAVGSLPARTSRPGSSSSTWTWARRAATGSMPTPPVSSRSSGTS